LVIETLDAGATPLRGRLVATAVRGYDRDLERVQDVLGSTLRLPETIVPLVDDAIVATGGRPAGTSAKLDLALTPEQPAEQAAAIVFARLLEVIDENLPGTLDDIDSEFLHDLRVAVRRTRSLQRQFKTIYPAERLEHFRAEFKRLQQATSDLRDLDVYLLDFDGLRDSLPEAMRADLGPLRAVLERRRACALSATRRALRGRRTQDALADWAVFVAEAPDSGRTVEALASKRIAAVYKKMVQMGRAIDDDSPAADLHELRKVGKELRYLLEFFASVYPPDVVKPMVKTLKGLQDMLGRFQDREVQANALRELSPEVADPAALMAMGVLVDRFMQEEAAARAEFADRFESFAGKPQRALVKDRFG
jgi:CHAD domain-containing protein